MIDAAPSAPAPAPAATLDAMATTLPSMRFAGLPSRIGPPPSSSALPRTVIGAVWPIGPPPLPAPRWPPTRVAPNRNAPWLASMRLPLASTVPSARAPPVPSDTFAPLAGLQAGLARVGAGDLGARVEVRSGDEFGAVALGFNRMAHTPQDLYQNLEAKVQDKTLHLDRRAARADAGAVRWSDEGNRRYVMLAADGPPDALVEGEHCIPTGACLCGAAQTDTRVIPIRPDGASPLLAGCLQAGYRSVVNVPLRLQERLIGELDLFYLAEPVLADDDRALLETLASHL
ncbi:MAG: HAMP domain-containing protein, partial [Burkholderiales bacterium]|nr:HAMP domain-containing protein [Burkholderiales bacterium]